VLLARRREEGRPWPGAPWSRSARGSGAASAADYLGTLIVPKLTSFAGRKDTAATARNSLRSKPPTPPRTRTSRSMRY